MEKLKTTVNWLRELDRQFVHVYTTSHTTSTDSCKPLRRAIESQASIARRDGRDAVNSADPCQVAVLHVDLQVGGYKLSSKKGTRRPVGSGEYLKGMQEAVEASLLRVEQSLDEQLDIRPHGATKSLLKEAGCKPYPGLSCTACAIRVMWDEAFRSSSTKEITLVPTKESEEAGAGSSSKHSES